MAQARAIRPQLSEMRSVITTEGGAPEWQDYTAWRDAQSADDPQVAVETVIEAYVRGDGVSPHRPEKADAE